ncbi:hypothetical protein [Corynebacterium sp. HMSC08A12]|nr:hypothetical protein [Corynebacterium sp. HMSC08A12]
MDITSAGEDVADGIEDGTQNLYEFLVTRASELTVEWRELPRT